MMSLPVWLLSSMFLPGGGGALCPGGFLSRGPLSRGVCCRGRGGGCLCHYSFQIEVS